MKTFISVFLVCLMMGMCTAQSVSAGEKPWEEVILRTETGTIPDTDRSYTVDIRFSPYGNEAYITYIIHENLFYESDAVYAIRDVARRLTKEFGYDWYSYTSKSVLRYDNVNHKALYRADIVFRKYFIQKEY